MEKMTVSDPRLEAQGDVPEDEDTPLRRLFSVVGGKFKWSIGGTSNGGCALSAPVVDEILAAPGSYLYTFPYAKSPAAGARGISHGLFADWLRQRPIVKETGPTCSPDLQQWNASSFFMGLFSPDDPIAKIESDGKSYTLDAVKLGDKHVTGNWTFTAKSQ